MNEKDENGDTALMIAVKRRTPNVVAELLKSPKDMEDARYLRIVYKETIDEREIDIIKKMIKRLRL